MKIFLPSLIACLFAAACGSQDTAPEPEPELPEEELVVIQRVGSQGGTLLLESPDGSTFEMRIPAGALSNEEEITIRRLPAASWPAETGENPPVGGAVYELLPEGLTFEAPITTISRFTQSPASLGMGSNNVFPSQVSRSSAGAIERHPTTLARRGTGSTIIGRTSHFSTHWIGTHTAQGEIGLELEWPNEPVEFGFYPAMALFTSSEEPISIPYRIGVFVPDRPVEEGSPLILPGYWETGTFVEGAELLSVLREHLDELGDEREIYSNYTVSFEDEVDGLPLAELQAGVPFIFEEWDAPNFFCGEVTGDGLGSGWLIMQVFLDEGGEQPLPLTFVSEETFDCSSLIVG
jgi:hypothetical protein